MTVKDGSMTADMKMGGTGYLKLYMGTGEEAAKAPEEKMIPFEEAGMGAIISRFRWRHWTRNWIAPPSARRKKNGMTVILVFRADSLPADALTDAAQVTAESLGLADGCLYRGGVHGREAPAG